jgi:hypothetical protein
MAYLGAPVPLSIVPPQLESMILETPGHEFSGDPDVSEAKTVMNDQVAAEDVDVPQTAGMSFPPPKVVDLEGDDSPRPEDAHHTEEPVSMGADAREPNAQKCPEDYPASRLIPKNGAVSPKRSSGVLAIKFIQDTHEPFGKWEFWLN